jgi:gliding motility-associated-like protein
VTITVEPLPVVVPNVSDSVICLGESVTFAGSGADTYTWTSPVLDGVPYSPTISATYTVTGSSSAGCVAATSASLTVRVNPLPQLTAGSSTAAVCSGQPLSFSASGVVSHTWDPPAANASTFVPLPSTVYTVTGTDNNGCVSTATLSPIVHPLPVITIAAGTGTSCSGETVTLTAGGAVSFTWNTGAFTNSVVDTPTISTNYSVTGTSAEGCVSATTHSQAVTDCAASIVASGSVKQISCGKKSDGSIAVESSVGYASYSIRYIWEPASLCPEGTCSTVDSLSPGTYSVMLVVTSTVNANYVRTDTLRLTSMQITVPSVGCKLEVYTGITPNNDNINDTWIIGNVSEFPNNHVWLYNRWGALVFETTGYNNEEKVWPQPAQKDKYPSGTYFYILDPGDGTQVLKGWLELLKN